MRQTILNSRKLSYRSVIFLSYLQEQLKSIGKCNNICINLFGAESDVGIGAADEDSWRNILLELSSKPINYLGSGDIVVQQWIYQWKLYGGELYIDANKALLDFTKEDLYILLSHCNYTPIIYGMIGNDVFVNAFTSNVDVDVYKMREACNCIDKYASFNNFRIKVIDASVEELSKIFNRKIDYSFLRSGKTVRALRFTIYSKKEEQNNESN